MIESPSLPPSADLQSEPLPLPERPFGAVARGAIGYGLLVGVMFVTVMVVFVPAALIHCALRYGRRVAWVALLIAGAIGVVYVGSAPSPSPELARLGWSYLAGVVLAIGVPSLAALPFIERREPFGRVLVFLLIAAAIGLALTEIGSLALTGYSPYAGQIAQTKQVAADLVKFYRANAMPDDVTRIVERIMGYTMFLLPAARLVQLAFAFVLSLLMIGRLKAWREHVARRSESDAPGAYLFRNLALPDWLLFGFVLGGLTPIATGLAQKIAANVLTVVVFLFVLQGLAIFRFMLVAVGAGVAGTMLGWALLAFLTMTGGIGTLLLGLAGLFDPFFDFRHFKKRKDDSHESHSD